MSELNALGKPADPAYRVLAWIELSNDSDQKDGVVENDAQGNDKRSRLDVQDNT